MCVCLFVHVLYMHMLVCVYMCSVYVHDCVYCTYCMCRFAGCVCVDDRTPLRILAPNHINLINRPGSLKCQFWRGNASRLVLSSSVDMAQETREPLARHQRDSRSNTEHVGPQ